MLTTDDTLYFLSLSYNTYTEKFWTDLEQDSSSEGKFFINLSRRIRPSRFITRNGEWPLLWKQEIVPGFEMPKYDPKFNLTFEECSDTQALEIKARIQKDEKFAIMYSGGIDSTVILASLIKNLTSKDLENIVVCATAESVIENPIFWNKFVADNLKILNTDNHKYDDLIRLGFTPITADEGDCIFGTLFGLMLYNNYDFFLDKVSSDSKKHLEKIRYSISDPNVHFSEYKDILIKYLGIKSNESFGEEFYNRLVHNINTATVPVTSLHDFFWWYIFNIKYINCSIRGSIYLNDSMSCKEVISKVINWFNHPFYQQWSMVNNNNGQKIRQTSQSYKYAAKKYIYDLDKNLWYLNFKTKIESLGNVGYRQNSIAKVTPNLRIGLTKNYDILNFKDPGVLNFLKESFTK